MPEYAKLLSLLPVDRAASALLAPATAVREATVGLARAARSWELTLATVAGKELEPGHGTPLPTAAARMVGEARAEDRVTQAQAQEPAPSAADASAGEPPVAGWAEMSPADARAALSDLSSGDLDALLTYERDHGHRMQYVLLLERRLEEARSA